MGGGEVLTHVEIECSLQNGGGRYVCRSRAYKLLLTSGAAADNEGGDRAQVQLGNTAAGEQ